MIDWWNSLEGLQKIFAYFAVPATLFLAIQMILTLFGLFNDTDADVEGGMTGHMEDMSGTDGHDSLGMHDVDDGTTAEAVHAMAGLKFFSIRGIITFLAVFGWVGMLLEGNGALDAVSIIVALLGGFAALIGIAFLFYGVSKLQSSGNIKIENAVGMTGEVYLKIPAKGKGEGKVNVILQERLVELKAVTDDDEDILTGADVKVLSALGDNKIKVTKI